MDSYAVAPDGQISWSGQNWYRTSGMMQPSMMVIEKRSPSYDEYADKKAREKAARKVPFGFARALEPV